MNKFGSTTDGKIDRVTCLTSNSEPNLSSALSHAFERNMREYYPTTLDWQNKNFVRLLSRFAKKLGLIRNFHSSTKNVYIVLLMGVGNQYRMFPRCYFNKIIPYCFDCWPDSWSSWQTLFDRNSTSVAFFSSKQVRDRFALLNPEMRCIWLPEATDPNEYISNILLKDREIDVLEMGRKHKSYHLNIQDSLLKLEKTHLYEKKEGQIIFDTREELIRGLSNSKISICFPASITHPSKAKNIETVTHRYFESIAAKCLILGHCPNELKDIFGYNPVIDAQLESASNQVINILSNIESYQEIVDKNYSRLLEVGTWNQRIETINREIGYSK
jgi:hypothetical protein